MTGVRDPAAADSQLTKATPWDYCDDIIDVGGPWAAAQQLKNTTGWKQDRSVEYWGITQHPGGFLKRIAPCKAEWKFGYCA